VALEEFLVVNSFLPAEPKSGHYLLHFGFPSLPETFYPVTKGGTHFDFCFELMDFSFAVTKVGWWSSSSQIKTLGITGSALDSDCTHVGFRKRVEVLNGRK